MHDIHVYSNNLDVTVQNTAPPITVTPAIYNVDIHPNTSVIEVRPSVNTFSVAISQYEITLQPTGIQGPPGSVWYNGTGAPSALLGANGDYYLDNVSRSYYEKVLGVWVLVGTFSGITAYTHTQNTAATTWTINHNLGRRPTITLFSIGNQVIEANLIHTSTNQAIAYFTLATRGTARCI
jgi:hypothetical protein